MIYWSTNQCKRNVQHIKSNQDCFTPPPPPFCSANQHPLLSKLSQPMQVLIFLCFLNWNFFHHCWCISSHVTTFSSTVVRMMMICYSNKDTFRHQRLFNQAVGVMKRRVPSLTRGACQAVKGRLSAFCRCWGGCSKCLTAFNGIIRGGGLGESPNCVPSYSKR